MAETTDSAEIENPCLHQGAMSPCGQTSVMLPGEVLTIMSALCHECNDILVRTHSIKIKTPPQTVRIPNIKT